MNANPLLRLSSIGWAAWLATVAAVALLCAVLAYWAMQLLAPPTPVAPAAHGPVARERADLGQAPLLFGNAQSAVAAPPPVLMNVQVVGVVAAASRGSAILIVDGKPARSYGVGDPLGPGQRLREVRADKVVIDDNGRVAEVPAPARASTAVLVSGAGRPRSPTDPALASPSGIIAQPGAATPSSGPLTPTAGAPLPAPGGSTLPAPGGSGLPPAGAPATNPSYVPTPGPMPGQAPAAPPALGKPGIPPA